MPEKCKQCRGKGHILLLISTVICDKCDGTGKEPCVEQDQIMDCFDESYPRASDDFTDD